MRRFLVILSILTGISVFAANKKEPVDYVDCFIGTSNSRWMLGPYAQRPMGMVHLGPDNQGNKWMGGYEYAISSVSGFSHIHAWTMGGLMMMPTTADLALGNPGPDSPYKGANAGYHSRIIKETEKATPGYYSVYLYDHDVNAEMTATKRCGFHRYTFPECSESRILVDLLFPTEWDYGFTVEDAKISKVGNSEIEGYAKCKSGNWSSWNDWTLYFVIRFNKPFKLLNGWNGDGEHFDIDSINGNNDIGVYAIWNTDKDESILAQSAISLVSIDGARNNLKVELDPFDWNFNQCVLDARNEWNEMLSRIKIDGGSDNDKRKFYTNLYRAFAGKQTWNDCDGKYRDAREEIRQLKPGKNIYGGDAFWNSFWNLNGLWTLTAPEIIDDWVTTQLEMFTHTGWTSKGPAGIEYSGIMEGSHEIALMVAAYQKGIRLDGDEIYNAVNKMVTCPGCNLSFGGQAGQIDLDKYLRYGYMPKEYNVVSKTLDYSYDDFCVAQLARRLSKNDEADILEQRAQNYRNVFHPQFKYVCQRDTLGNWDPDFDLFSNKGFIEGNSWQYSWYVPHDIKGLINLIGLEVAFKRLSEGFEKSRKYNFAAHVFDRTMGQSAEFYVNQGNEVNMSAAFIFNYLGYPELCQKYTHEILERYYGDTPYHGWEGDEDEGQMGAWFVMTALGLFEMDGGVTSDSRIDLTSPLFKRSVISLNKDYYTGTEFIIEAKNLSEKNRYIRKATLNGQELLVPRIPFNAIIKGGKLVYEMTSNPEDVAWK